jgi:serine/threonine protein kinase
MFREDGEGLWIDFGLSIDAQALADGSLQGSNHGGGSVSFMAPEVATSSEHVSAQADIYSLGVSIYDTLVSYI